MNCKACGNPCTGSVTPMPYVGAVMVWKCTTQGCSMLGSPQFNPAGAKPAATASAPTPPAPPAEDKRELLHLDRSTEVALATELNQCESLQVQLDKLAARGYYLGITPEARRRLAEAAKAKQAAQQQTAKKGGKP